LGLYLASDEGAHHNQQTGIYKKGRHKKVLGSPRRSEDLRQRDLQDQAGEKQGSTGSIISLHQPQAKPITLGGKEGRNCIVLAKGDPRQQSDREESSGCKGGTRSTARTVSDHGVSPG